MEVGSSTLQSKDVEEEEVINCMTGQGWDGNSELARSIFLQKQKDLSIPPREYQNSPFRQVAHNIARCVLRSRHLNFLGSWWGWIFL